MNDIFENRVNKVKILFKSGIICVYSVYKMANGSEQENEDDLYSFYFKDGHYIIIKIICNEIINIVHTLEELKEKLKNTYINAEIIIENK